MIDRAVKSTQVQKGDRFKKSDGHLCWAAHQPLGEHGSIAMYRVEDPKSPPDTGELFEFFYTMDGPDGNTPTIWKARADTPLTGKSGEKLSNCARGVARHDCVVITHGAWHSQKCIKRIGADVPAEIRDAVDPEAESAGVVDGADFKPRHKPRRPAMAAKSKTGGLSVTAMWEKLLIANEKAPKAKKMTDAQLVAAMQKEFPDKRESTTLTRCSMIRGCYNKGTNLFKARFGCKKANGKNRPQSCAYDKDGALIENPRSQPRDSSKKKAGSKKAGSKKTSSKKKGLKKKGLKRRLVKKGGGKKKKKTASKKK